MYKKLVVISILVFGGIVIFLTRPFERFVDRFELIDQVEERQFVGVFNMTKLLDDAKTISTKLKTFGLAEQYFSEVTKTMKQSGLRLDKVYYSLETRDTLKRSLYFEIVDRAALESTFRNFSNFYDLRQDSIDTSLYVAQEENLAIRFEEKWVELIQGDISQLKHTPGLSSTARQLLEEEHFFAFNPTPSKHFDSLEYITGTYSYDSIFTIEGEWMYLRSNDHPVQSKAKNINYYPTEETIIEAFLNVDRKAWKNYENKFLANRLEKIYSVGMFDYAALSENWEGQFAFDFGGQQLIENKTTVTEFDENFNQIEKTIVKTDTMRDVGFVFSSTNAEKLHQELINQPNIEEKKGSTYIALLPPLHPVYKPEHLALAAGEKPVSQKNTNDKVAHFQFLSPQLNIISDAKTEGQVLQFKFEIIPQTSEKFKPGEIVNVFI